MVPKPLLKEIFFKYMISGHDDIIKVIKKIEHKERTEDKDQKEVDTTIKSFVNRNGY